MDLSEMNLEKHINKSLHTTLYKRNAGESAKFKLMNY